MNERNDDVMSSADREIITTRVLDAPRELAWRAWTDPKHVAEWWGPMADRLEIQLTKMA